MSPLVSVIVPNYNHADFIEQRLESILNQSFQDYEIILLDDCSEDHSRELLLKFKNYSKVSHCIFNEVNSGNTYKQWNKGIKLARGKFIWIAESDDFSEPDFLQEAVGIIKKDDQINLVFCQSNRVNSLGHVTGNWLDHTNTMDTDLFNSNFILSGNEFNYQFLIEKNVIPNASAVVFRRSIIDQIGFLNENEYLKYNGDWLLYFKLITNSKIAFIANSLNNFRFHNKSVIATAVQNKKRLFLLEIELFTRRKMTEFLVKEGQGEFYLMIKRKNYSSVKVLKYEKAKIYFCMGKSLKAYLSLIPILDFVIKKNSITKSFKAKVGKFYKPNS